MLSSTLAADDPKRNSSDRSTSVSVTLPVLVTVTVYWITSPTPFLVSPLSSTLAALTTLIAAVRGIRSSMALSVLSVTSLPSGSLDVTLAVFDTPPALTAC